MDQPATGDPGLEAIRRRVHRQIHRPSSSGRLRFLIALAGGLLVAVGLTLIVGVRYGVLIGLMATCVTYVVWSYAVLRRFDGHATKAHSRLEDTGAALANIGGAVVILADLGAVITLLVLDQRKQAEAGDALLALGGVLASWCLLHTLYVPRYAGLYYRGDTSGGIDFNADGYWPNYGDFTYFAFNLGMTYQVSDTSVTDPHIRRLVLQHCLLSYFFATLITAAVINLVLGLVG